MSKHNVLAEHSKGCKHSFTGQLAPSIDRIQCKKATHADGLSFHLTFFKGLSNDIYFQKSFTHIWSSENKNTLLQLDRKIMLINKEVLIQIQTLANTQLVSQN